MLHRTVHGSGAERTAASEIGRPSSSATSMPSNVERILVPVVHVPHPAFIPIPKPNYNHPLIAIAYIYMRRAPRKARRRPAQPPGGPTWAQPYRMRGPFGTHNIQHTACTHIEVVSQVALAIDKLCLLLSARTHTHFVGSVRPPTLNERVAYLGVYLAVCLAEPVLEPIARLRSNDLNRRAATALPRSVWIGRALRWLSSLMCLTNESPPRIDPEWLLAGECDGEDADTNINGVGRFDEK